MRKPKLVVDNKPLICSICEEPIPVRHGTWKWGCNAEPVNSGRCCYDCDAQVVIPLRIARFRQWDREQKDK